MTTASATIDTRALGGKTDHLVPESLATLTGIRRQAMMRELRNAERVSDNLAILKLQNQVQRIRMKY